MLSCTTLSILDIDRLAANALAEELCVKLALLEDAEECIEELHAKVEYLQAQLPQIKLLEADVEQARRLQIVAEDKLAVQERFRKSLFAMLDAAGVPTFEDEAGDIRRRLAWLIREYKHGIRFKALVHDKLDAAAVPRFEDATCRVGHRLDFLILKAMSAPGPPAGIPDHA